MLLRPPSGLFSKLQSFMFLCGEKQYVAKKPDLLHKHSFFFLNDFLPFLYRFQPVGVIVSQKLPRTHATQRDGVAADLYCHALAVVSLPSEETQNQFCVLFRTPIKWGQLSGRVDVLSGTHQLQGQDLFLPAIWRSLLLKDSVVTSPVHLAPSSPLSGVDHLILVHVWKGLQRIFILPPTLSPTQHASPVIPCLKWFHRYNHVLVARSCLVCDIPARKTSTYTAQNPNM